MANRAALTTQNTAQTDCGCPTKKVVNAALCQTVGCSDCPVTLKPIKRKSRTRVCFDFSTCFCDDDGACCGGTYSQIRTYCTEKRNPRGCPETPGYIRITDPKFDHENGKMWFSVDAYDSRLVAGERFYIEIWAELPNRNETSISAYISVS